MNPFRSIACCISLLLCLAAVASTAQQDPQSPTTAETTVNPVVPKPGEPAQQKPTNAPLERLMEQPVNAKMAVPKDELLAAKTMAVIAFGPEKSKGAKRVVEKLVMPGGIFARRATAVGGKEEALKQIKEWKRYAVVEEASAADLVIAIREWPQDVGTSHPTIAARIALLKGGPDILQNPQLLWAAERVPYIGTVYDNPTKDLLAQLGREIKRASKEAKKM